MLIGVVSDTHITGRGRKLPPVLIEGLSQVDAIIHAGDWMTLDVYEELSKLAPVQGVAGNGDGDEVSRYFGMKRIADYAGIRIGIVHGHEGPGKTTPERARLAFRDDTPDIVVFGHSHIPMQKRAGSVLLFNPGSPTDKRRQPLYSYGLIHIRDGEFAAEHRYFS